MPATERAPDRAQCFGAIVVIGGGCYGSYYVRQLRRAASAGAIRCRELIVVDRASSCAVASTLDDAVLPARLVVAEWADFLRGFLADVRSRGTTDDAIVPSPLMPHLLRDWLVDAARERWPARGVRTAPLLRAPDMPWQQAAPDGTHYVSFATWMCPINCIEPATCPHTRGPRAWSMAPALRAYAERPGTSERPVAGPFLFRCTHRAWGVGMIDVRDVLAADAELAQRGAAGPVEALVGTVSHCHGAVSRIVVGGAGDRRPD
ncbi:MAG TPA: hypothetical protein VG818_04765 [Gemmatimonadaceae bacterium]|jgi:hypothetical protein|nr:hypothetical protein [Gemmatimonadaceae bacterium]